MPNEKEPIQEINNAVSPVQALQQIFGNDLQKLSSGLSQDDLKDVENIKLIIGAILTDDLLESLTNLREEERDDLVDAYFLNEYFDNPRIDIFIMHHLKLSRSVIPKDEFNNLLRIFSDISGKSMRMIGDIGDTKGIFGNRFKR